MQLNKEQIQRATKAIDRIVEVAIKWMETDENHIRTEFMKVFAGETPELISHLMDKWDGDFARFYLNADERRRRKIFTHYEIPLEADKYPDSESLNLALIDENPHFEVFPFESYLVHLFFLTAFNHSLDVLNEIVPDAFIRIKASGTDLYGNGENWSEAWLILTREEKAALTEYIMQQEI